MPTAHPSAEIIERSARLAKAFRERGLSVVLVNVTGVAPGRTEAGPFKLPPMPADWTEFAPELGRQPTDHVVTKQRIGAFIGTDLDSYLRQRSATQVVLTGIATGSGVEATARSLHDAGYNLTLVIDAMTDRSAEIHTFFVEKVFPRIAETGTTEDVLKLMAQRK